VIQWGFFFVATGAVMGWVGRSRLRPTSVTAPGRLAHPPSTLIVGVVCSGLFGLLAALSIASSGAGARLAGALFLVLASMSVLVVLDYCNARHSLRPDGLEYGRMLGGGGVLLWSDVHRIHYSQPGKWFRLEARDGRVVRISAMLQGLPEFAREALAHLPATAMDAKTRWILAETEQGRLPPIWQ
jgi:hypothetical protein